MATNQTKGGYHYVGLPGRVKARERVERLARLITEQSGEPISTGKAVLRAINEAVKRRERRRA